MFAGKAFLFTNSLKENFDFPEKYHNLEVKFNILNIVHAKLYNEKKEMLDYPRVKRFFQESTGRSSREIIRQLSDAGKKWREDQNQNDDITFVIIKMK